MRKGYAVQTTPRAGFCTDKGTERLMVDVCDMLQVFFDFIGTKITVAPQLFNFPLAIWVYCWQHMFDLVAKMCLHALPWFKSWLADLKELARFLRIDTYRKVVAAKVAELGFDDTRLKFKPPKNASWRWSTLHSALKYFVGAYIALVSAWSIALFSKSKEKSLLATTNRALTSVAWWERFRVVADLVNALHCARVWASRAFATLRKD